MLLSAELWAAIPIVVAIYCLVQSVLDFRRNRYATAVIGLACGLAILLTPIRSHAVKFDLIPPPVAAR